MPIEHLPSRELLAWHKERAFVGSNNGRQLHKVKFHNTNKLMYLCSPNREGLQTTYNTLKIKHITKESN